MRDQPAALAAGRQTVLAEEFSAQVAADILQMSRLSVMRLIEKGLLHTRKALSHNKLLRAEVEALQAAQTRQQRQALSNPVTVTEDYDF
jgi:hypothetical protein